MHFDIFHITSYTQIHLHTHLEASTVFPVVEAQAVMSSLVGCQAWGHPTPQAWCKVQVDWAGPSQSWGCYSRTV